MVLPAVKTREESSIKLASFLESFRDTAIYFYFFKFKFKLFLKGDSGGFTSCKDKKGVFYQVGILSWVI